MENKTVSDTQGEMEAQDKKVGDLREFADDQMLKVMETIANKSNKLGVGRTAYISCMCASATYMLNSLLKAQLEVSGEQPIARFVIEENVKQIQEVLEDIKKEIRRLESRSEG